MKITKGIKPSKIEYKGSKRCKISQTGTYIEIDSDDMDFINEMKDKGFT